MQGGSRFIVALAAGFAVALAVAATAGAAEVPQGPDGDAFYDPPPSLVRSGAPGTAIWMRPANPTVTLAGGARTLVFAYRSISVRGVAAAMSASLTVPKGDPPPAGWPTVVWNHVTTGSADVCAPSRAAPGNTELERMTRADAMMKLLLADGIAVVRPDFEGVGTPGPHPYLIGQALARAPVDAMRAARDVDAGLGATWALAGHSEGGVTALFAGQAARRIAPELTLRAVEAMAPPTHLHDLMEGLSPVPVANQATAGLTALAGLILGGAAAYDPALWKLYRDGGLSEKALALMPDLERRCLNDLTAADSWGGIAPSEVTGPNAGATKPRLYADIDAGDPKNVTIAGLPIRLDQGMSDAVVPFPFTEELVQTLKGKGMDVSYQRYPQATHVTISDPDQAGAPAAAWLAEALK